MRFGGVAGLLMVLWAAMTAGMAQDTAPPPNPPPPAKQGGGGDVFTFPQAGAIVFADSEITVTWTPRTSDPISLFLQPPAPAPPIPIATEISNSGSFVWKLPRGSTGPGRTLLLRTPGTPGTVTAVSGVFTIAPPAVKTVVLVTTSTRAASATTLTTFSTKPPSVTDTTLLLDVAPTTGLGGIAVIGPSRAPPPPPQKTTESVSGGDKSSTRLVGVIAGATTGGCVLVALALGAIMWWFARRRRPSEELGNVTAWEEEEAARRRAVGIEDEPTCGMQEYGKKNVDEYRRTMGMVNRF